MRECETCRGELHVVDSYVALEGAQEVEVVRWRCAACGHETEAADRVLEPA